MNGKMRASEKSQHNAPQYCTSYIYTDLYIENVYCVQDEKFFGKNFHGSFRMRNEFDLHTYIKKRSKFSKKKIANGKKEKKERAT